MRRLVYQKPKKEIFNFIRATNDKIFGKKAKENKNETTLSWKR